MKKTTLPAAALGVLACATAQAQSGLVFFGTVDLFLGRATSGPTSVMRLQDGGHGATQFGLQGREDLGGGWYARFRLDAGASADTGQGTQPGPSLAFTRQSFAGIEGPVGRLDLGRMYTPLFSSVSRADPYALNTVFSPLNLAAAIDAQPGQISFASRANNMLRYRSPIGTPLTLDLAYSMGESAGAGNRSGDLYGASLGWTRSDFYISYAIQRVRSGTAASPGTRLDSSTYQALSAALRGSQHQFFAHYILNDSTRPGIRQARIWSLGSAWQISQRSRLVAEAARRSVAGSGRGQWAWTLGFDQALSKRTTVYARWLKLDNRGGSSASLGQVAVAVDSGDGASLLGIGIRHNF